LSGWSRRRKPGTPREG